MRFMGSGQLRNRHTTMSLTFNAGCSALLTSTEDHGFLQRLVSFHQGLEPDKAEGCECLRPALSRTSLCNAHASSYYRGLNNYQYCFWSSLFCPRAPVTEIMGYGGTYYMAINLLFR